MTWTITIDQLGRPWLANEAHRQHYRVVAARRKDWRTTTYLTAIAARVPMLNAINVTAQARYPGGRLCDADATAPSVKGCIDGLVDAQVIPDDSPHHLRSVTYLAPAVVKGLPPALILTIEEAQ